MLGWRGPARCRRPTGSDRRDLLVLDALAILRSQLGYRLVDLADSPEQIILGANESSGFDINASSLATSSTSLEISQIKQEINGLIAVTGRGDDKIVGSNYSDFIQSNGGRDSVLAGRGNDVVVGGAGEGDDSYDGGADVDTLMYSSAAIGISVDLSSGRASGVDIGTDAIRNFERVVGSIGNDRIFGAAKAELLIGGAGNDELMGRDGADTLDGGTGKDTLLGGAGNDLYIVDVAGDRVFETTTATSGIDAGGIDTIQGAVSLGLNSGAAFVENLTLTGSGHINGTGNALANVLTGNAGDNVLDGGAGADRMAGGAGRDTYRVDQVGDRVTELADQGIDRVVSSVSYSINYGTAQGVERLALTGSDAINATGNALANVLTGNTGNNVLNGGAGADRLEGNGGADIFEFRDALGPSNIDTIIDFSVVDDTIRLENAVFTAIGGTGTLTAARFVANSTGLAADSSDRIVYDTVTGKLFYDSNGNAAGGSVQFAKLDPGLALTQLDFLVI